MNIDAKDNQFVSYRQLSSFEIKAERQLPLNLDGEPLRGSMFRFETLPKRLAFALPPDAPLMHASES